MKDKDFAVYMEFLDYSDVVDMNHMDTSFVHYIVNHSQEVSRNHLFWETLSRRKMGSESCLMENVALENLKESFGSSEDNIPVKAKSVGQRAPLQKSLLGLIAHAGMANSNPNLLQIH